MSQETSQDCRFLIVSLESVSYIVGYHEFVVFRLNIMRLVHERCCRMRFLQTRDVRLWRSRAYEGSDLSIVESLLLLI